MVAKCKFHMGLFVGSVSTFILFQLILYPRNIGPLPYDTNYMFNPNLNQNDSKLIQIIRNEYLVGPSSGDYHLMSPSADTENSGKQTETVLKLLQQKKNGFFFESRANDGEYLSSSLSLERDHGWTGLLVEPDPYAYAQLLKKNRKAWKSPVGLSTVPFPHKVALSHHNDFSVSSGNKTVRIDKGRKADGLHGTCLPGFSLLAALNITSVDYFSLDVEGAELKVLKTIPFDSIFIKVFSIEFDLISEGKDALKNFMETKEYVFVKQFMRGHAKGCCFNVFIHKSLKDNIKYIFQ